MKLKNSLLSMVSLSLLLLIAGCDSGALNTTRCKETVERKYPRGNVVTLPYKHYRFLVAVDCQVRLVETMGGVDEITNDTLLMVVPECDERGDRQKN